MSDIEQLLASLNFDKEDVREAAVFAARAAFVTVVDRLLESREWTRKRLAKEMGVSAGRISQILSDSDVTFSNAVAVLFCLGVDTSSVLHEIGQPRGPS